MRLRTYLGGAPPLLLGTDVLEKEPSQALRVHRIYNSARLELRGPRIVLDLLWWTITIVFQVPTLVLRFGGKVEALCGKGRLRQALDQLQLLVRHGLPPFAYYTFELYDDARFQRASEYLHRWEMKIGGLYKLARRSIGKRKKRLRRILMDKRCFHAHCVDEGLPVIPVLAEVVAGELRSPDGAPTSLPDRDLFVKPVIGKGGEGSAAFQHLGGGRFRDGAGGELPERELAARLVEQAGDRAFLVQPRLANHPEIAELGDGVLTTVRIVTVRDEHGSPEVAWATFRLGSGRGSIVDNLHQGGFACAVEPATGRLGTAGRLAFGSPHHELHPVSGKPLAGRCLPIWGEAIELALRAHRTIPEQLVVGWDIALTPEGPLLVEGNGSPCVVMAQKLTGEPLGSGRFGALLLFHLEGATFG